MDACLFVLIQLAMPVCRLAKATSCKEMENVIFVLANRRHLGECRAHGVGITIDNFKEQLGLPAGLQN